MISVTLDLSETEEWFLKQLTEGDLDEQVTDIVRNELQRLGLMTSGH